MHTAECGKDFVGLCDKMKPIDGEKLLRFLRKVNFTGKLSSICWLNLSCELSVDNLEKEGETEKMWQFSSCRERTCSLSSWKHEAKISEQEE